MSQTSMNNIHWFPGHMKKALNQIKEKIKLVDVIIEIIDARIPFSSLNPDLEKLINDKPRLLILSKSDMADEKITQQWANYFSTLNYRVCTLDLKGKTTRKIISQEIGYLYKTKKDIFIKKGMKPQPPKAMIIGIPNVGKSTLINLLAKRSAAGVENRPGFTRAQQWIKVDDSFYLLDTPGVLPMNYDDKQKAANLALTGAIREDILPNHILCDILLNHLKTHYPNSLFKRFKINDINIDNQNILFEIARSRGLKKGADFDLDKAMIVLLKEFKSGEIGRISLDWL